MSTDQKEEILSRLTVEDIYGTDLKKSTKSFKRCCPFHEEKTPSFHAFEKDLSYHCFGCHESGSAFTYIMKTEHVDFPEALRILAKRAGVELKEERNGRHKRLYDINAEALLFYESVLAKSPAAMEYLKVKRGLTEESIARFHLGMSDGSPKALVQHLKSKGYTEDEMTLASLAVRKGSELRDFFASRRILFPIIRGGKIKGFGARDLSGTSELKYFNSAETPVFKKSECIYGVDSLEIKKRGFAIVVEGYLDVVTWHQNGYLNTVAPMGTALTEPHVELLKKYTDTVIVIFDGDAAGRKAGITSVKMFFDAKFKGYAVNLPEGDDPDSYVRKGNPVEPLLESALPFSVFLLRNNLKGTRQMLYRAMLGRSPRERIEYVAYAATLEERAACEQFDAMSLLRKCLAKAAIVTRRENIEVRLLEGELVVTVDKRYLMKEPLERGKDSRVQADELLTFIHQLKWDKEKKSTAVPA